MTRSSCAVVTGAGGARRELLRSAAMKAVVQDRYGSAEVLRLADVERPAPGDGEVLVRIYAAGVDPGVWHLMTGEPYLVRLAFGLRRPKVRVRGTDLAGRVEAVGTNVTRFAPGDEVFGVCAGSFAEYGCAKQTKLARKPRNLTFEQAAAIPASGVTALQALREAGQLEPGESVLVIGAAGGVGSFAVQVARALGAAVTGVCSTGKVELVRSLGADRVIDYTREDFADGTARYDLIVDTAGGRPLSQLRRALQPEGTLVIVGGEGGGRWLGGMRRALRAALLSRVVHQKLRMLLAVVRGEDLEALGALAEAGKLTPVVDRTYPLRDVADAVRHVAQWHARGKVVVAVGRAAEG